jgi:hypothetical protein
VWSETVTESFVKSNSTSFVYAGSYSTTYSSKSFNKSHSNPFIQASYSNPFTQAFNNVFGTLPTMRWQELEWTNVLRQKECMPGYQ